MKERGKNGSTRSNIPLFVIPWRAFVLLKGIGRLVSFFNSTHIQPMTAPSSNASDTTDDAVSFFDMASGTESAAEADRVQELKRMLFDLAYLVMNADGTEHISEKMLIRKLENRMEREGSVDVDARADDLALLLEEGPEAIRDRVDQLATQVAEKAGDQTQALGAGYLDFLKGLIVADASVATEEYELFDLLCEEWDVEKELPRS